MEEMYSHIANLGFPIVISMYLLIRIEGKLNQLTESINELAKVISGIKSI
ncbi:MAG: YvrJ family protein [Tissierellia bacterium]|nr:YvrJ family protein [Tissierellia bacterium]